jgi:hypothetical protein
MALGDPVCWRSPSRYIVGVDLGQSSDPTAICVLDAYAEREDPVEPIKSFFDVRHLQRLRLGMTYPAMVQDIGHMMLREPLRSAGAELVIDETGVGRAVGDIFAASGLKPIRVTITAGNEESHTGVTRYSVPKSVLVSTLDARLHTGELRFAKELREAPAMESELKDFRRHVSDAGRFSFEARSGKHDDLVLACAIALWRAVRKKPRFDDGPRREPEVILGYAGSKR